ncbi:MAG: hypothetical protein A2Z21_07335 [Candidatus Fraserbacteria bacterium RBG_16_55_9]|uniref:Uncharacterized protein n=1 Tax=Fraserbacteria sp. (strain RBG_16_55_9) TaxID=1817864 RepID=A0A1F5V0H4_FRAXR|nr:MAG: hypothetical protein A2Z21_07335 [Candidatus Fraserbacteria bacterium RBG_16_55_9]
MDTTQVALTDLRARRKDPDTQAFTPSELEDLGLLYGTDIPFSRYHSDMVLHLSSQVIAFEIKQPTNAMVSPLTGSAVYSNTLPFPKMIPSTLGSNVTWNYDYLLERLLSAARSDLNNLYEFVKKPEVDAYLQRYKFLERILAEAAAEIREAFGFAINLSLEVRYDPEAPDEAALFAYIHTDLPPDEALEKLDRFDQEWLLDQLDRIDGKLNFNLKYI